ncbi:MAG: hypothetical protein Q7S47_02815 [bacterium]|nr:hypothetical protein [bacterium]
MTELREEYEATGIDVEKIGLRFQAMLPDSQNPKDLRIFFAAISKSVEVAKPELPEIAA